MNAKKQQHDEHQVVVKNDERHVATRTQSVLGSNNNIMSTRHKQHIIR